MNLNQRIAQLEQENRNLRGKVVRLSPAQPTAQELELQAKTRRIEAAIALQESTALKDEISTVLKDNKERVTPLMVQKKCINYTDKTYDSETASFSEQTKTCNFDLAGFMERIATGRTGRGDYEGFKGWLSDLGAREVVSNGEVSFASINPGRQDSSCFSEVSLSAHDMIMERATKIAELRNSNPMACYSEAMGELFQAGIINY